MRPETRKALSGFSFFGADEPVVHVRSARLGNQTRADAAGADVFTHYASLFHDAQPLDVRLPGFGCLFIGMAHAVSEQDRFAAYFALGHEILRIESDRHTYLPVCKFATIFLERMKKFMIHLKGCNAPRGLHHRALR